MGEDPSAHRELGAGRAIRGNFLAAQTQDAMLVEQQLVEKHQLVLDFDGKTRTAFSVFDDDQFLEVLLAFGVAPQAGNSLYDTGERFDRGRFAGAFSIEYLLKSMGY